MTSRFRALAIVGLILLLAGLLRLGGLESQSLWNDELSSWARSNQDSLAAVLENGVRRDRHPPGYRFLMYFVITQGGDSPSWLRLPSAIAGVLGILAVSLLGQALFDRRTGQLAAALGAVSWAHVYYSQDATAYSLTFLLVTLSAWLACRTLRKPAELDHAALAGFGLLAVTTAYVHYYGALIVGFIGVALLLASLWRGWRQAAAVAAVGLVAVLAYLPWLPLLRDQLAVGRAGGFPVPDATLFGKLLLFLNQGSILFSALFVALVLYLGYDLARRWRAGPDRQAWSDILVLAWLVVPTGTLVAISLLYRPLVADRHMMVILPAALLLVARALVRVADVRRRSLAPAAALLIAALAGHLIFVQDYFSRPTKQQFREASELALEAVHAHPDALVIGYAWSPAYLNYYLRDRGEVLALQHAGLGRESQLTELEKLVARDRPSHIVYITAHRRPRRAFVEGLTSYGTLLKDRQLIGASVRLIEIERSSRP